MPATCQRLSSKDGKQCCIHFPITQLLALLKSFLYVGAKRVSWGTCLTNASCQPCYAGWCDVFSAVWLALRVTHCRESICLTPNCPTSSPTIKCHCDLVWCWSIILTPVRTKEAIYSLSTRTQQVLPNPKLQNQFYLLWLKNQKGYK